MSDRRQSFTSRPVAPTGRRILMVNLIDWESPNGGALHQLGLMQSWIAAGHEVRMLSPERGERRILPANLRSRLTGTPSLKRYRLPAMFDTAMQLPALIGACLSFRPHVVYTRMNTLTPLAVALCRALGVKVVVEHNSWLAKERRLQGGSGPVAGLEWLGQIAAARLADASRCVTRGMSERLAALGVSPDRLASIGNGTDVGQFFPFSRSMALKAYGLPADRTYVGYIGNIMRWHGLETALEGFARAAAPHPDIDLVIFGDGPSRPELEAQAHRLGIGRRIHFLGRVPLENANLAINAIDVAVLPLSARNDAAFGFSSIKIRDYAAAGRIVLTGHVPGNIELAGEPWLWTHKPDDGADMGAQLAAILDDREHWPAARLAARRHAEASFSWPVIARQIDAVFDRLLADARPARAGAADTALTPSEA